MKGNCIVYVQMYLETWKYLFCEALARFARSLAHVSYFLFVGTFGGLAPPPPPNTKKLATLVCPRMGADGLWHIWHYNQDIYWRQFDFILI